MFCLFASTRAFSSEVLFCIVNIKYLTLLAANKRKRLKVAS